MSETRVEVQVLARKVAAERLAAAPQAVRFSKGLRQQVVAATRLPGQGRKGLAGQLGLSASVIQNWIAMERRASKPVPVPVPVPTAKPKMTQPRLQRVTVEPSPSSPSGGLQLVFPSGVRLIGLTLQQLRELVGAGL